MNRIRSGRKKKSLRIAAVLTAMALCAGMWGQAGLVGRASNSLGSQTGQEAGGEGGEEAPAEGLDGEDVEAQIVDENTESVAGTSTAARVRVIPASARLRGEASTDSAQVGSLSSGDEIGVVGETTGSDGNLWYQVSGEVNGQSVSGYIRSDLVEVTETVQAETPAETPSDTPTEAPAETESTPTDEYSVSYADDGTGTGVSDWYLNDNINGTRYKISDLLNAQQTNESNIALMEEQTGSMRMVIIILAVIIALLVVVVTILIFKLRSSYDDEDDYDVDDYDEEDEDEDEEEDDEDDEEEDDEDDYRPRKRRGAVRRPARTRQTSRRRRYEDDEDEEDEDDRYEDEEEEDEPPRRSSRQSGRAKSQKSYKPKNFVDVDDDDDLDFEFLDLK
ncbi:MAG TPA: SH3 domain-containing protein [Candidatus Eisenbergiella merdipullorum]|uniref:SH3 domain-containing protein n=1 Tax=Candidatus Eisenbergiella merdipullorum TaxID=2838553 RepID=A0A9D2L139_9FIRM|nr:SH3 domain-containing protein [Candidatus Eisenbergiella merdipullorum]